VRNKHVIQDDRSLVYSELGTAALSFKKRKKTPRLSNRLLTS